MKRSINEIINYDIQTRDGIKGKVKDILFDEERWIIRYVEAGLGLIFPGKKVLIPRMFLKEPDWANQLFPVELDKADIEKCPPLEDKLPISRKYEKELSDHYEVDYYWLPDYIPPVGVGTPVTYPPRPVRAPGKIIHEQDIDTKLRSFKEMQGYHIKTRNGKLGHIDDIIVDDYDWQVVYVLVDTSNWMPWSKRVLIGIEWMKKVSYADQEIEISLDTEMIKSAPDFEGSVLSLTESYENRLYNHYGKIPVSNI